MHLVPLLIGKDKAAYVAMEIEDPLVYDLRERYWTSTRSDRNL